MKGTLAGGGRTREWDSDREWDEGKSETADSVCDRDINDGDFEWGGDIREEDGSVGSLAPQD